MKRIILLSFFSSLLVSSILMANDSSLKKDFIKGDPGITSINAMAFGPEGVLFIGDSKSAEITAIDLSGHQKADNSKVKISNVDQIISQKLGSSIEEIQITDMAVNPENQNIYLSIMHSSGKPVLFMVQGSDLLPVLINNVSFSKIALDDPIAIEAKDRRDRSLRKWAISDLHYNDGKIMVSGLSNNEFASTFRSIDFPYNKQQYSSLKIYHAAHGQYETHSPIKAFTTAQINGAPHMVASYTCTPLVVFPISEMKSGQLTEGRTVAELGNRNTPLDIIEMESESERVLLMANSTRALMKIKISDIESFGDSLSEPVEENSATAGIDFINLPLVNVQQLAKLSSNQFVILRRSGSGDLALSAEGRRWL